VFVAIICSFLHPSSSPPSSSLLTSIMYASQQSTSLFLGGERTSGQTIRDQNGMKATLLFVRVTRLFPSQGRTASTPRRPHMACDTHAGHTRNRHFCGLVYQPTRPSLTEYLGLIAPSTTMPIRSGQETWLENIRLLMLPILTFFCF
jgi:hypothetical protein